MSTPATIAPGRYRTTLALCLLFATAFSTNPASPRRLSQPELKQKIAFAIQLNKEADEKLYVQMRSVAEWLKAFRFRNGHYPDSPLERDDCRLRICWRLTLNPYTPAETLSEEDRAKPDENRVQIKLDHNIDQLKLERAVKTPPDDWLALPGTIVIISNGDDKCYIWAAGSDERPIRAPESGDVRLIAL